MGYWGAEPWANDRVQDWLIDVFEQTKLHEIIHDVLIRDVDVKKDMDEIRGAAMLLILLDRAYPAEEYEKHVELAIKKMTEIRRTITCTNRSAKNYPSYLFNVQIFIQSSNFG